MPGVSSYCLMDQPLDLALDRLSCITGLIEIVDEGPHYITDPGLLESFSVDFTIHAPYHGMNIACPFEAIREASVSVMVDCFHIAAEAGAGVVLHPGYYAWQQEQERADRQFRRSLHELNTAAEDLSVRFYFENMGDMNYFNLRTPDDLSLIDDAGFALDVGHAYLNGCLPGFLEAPIDHVHLHDNDGRRDTHSPVGEGGIDFHPVMEAIRRNHATAVIEVRTWDGVLRSIEALASL